MNTAQELKRRFTVVAHLYLNYRAEKQFKDMENLIMNFDKKPDYKEKVAQDEAKRPKLSNFRIPSRVV